jgi:hypothetical protein
MSAIGAVGRLVGVRAAIVLPVDPAWTLTPVIALGPTKILLTSTELAVMPSILQVVVGPAPAPELSAVRLVVDEVVTA